MSLSVARGTPWATETDTSGLRSTDTPVIGWDGALMGLGLHVETGDTVTGEAAEQLPFTDEGRAFYRACADGWTDAAIAAGEDPAAMRAAGEGAYAFYTTVPGS